MSEIDKKRVKKQVLLQAAPNSDEPVDDLDEVYSFYTLIGKCKKCDVGNYTLIITDFKENKSDRGEGIFRTTCLCCNGRDIYYAKQVTIS